MITPQVLTALTDAELIESIRIGNSRYVLQAADRLATRSAQVEALTKERNELRREFDLYRAENDGEKLRELDGFHDGARMMSPSGSYTRITVGDLRHYKTGDPCFDNRLDGEPTFTLLGRDPQAPDLIHKWADDRERCEGWSDKVIEAHQKAGKFKEWKQAHPKPGMATELYAKVSHAPAPAEREKALEEAAQVFTGAIKWLRGYAYTMRAHSGGVSEQAVELEQFIDGKYLPAISALKPTTEG